MQYEERFGVKVDTQIPEGVKARLYQQWERWKEGADKGYCSLAEPNLLTRVEHFFMGSGVGLPPDPFKPLALQHDGADLEAVIQARREAFPPGEKYTHLLYAAFVPDFQKITGLDRFAGYVLGSEYPEIDKTGRIRIPKILGVYDRQQNKIDFPEEVIAQLQLPTSRDNLRLWDGVTVREVFDFEIKFIH